MNLLGAHAVGLPYDRKSDSPTLACAADLPRDPTQLLKYAKDARFNGKTERVVFHVRFLTSVPVIHLKRAYYPEIGRVGRPTMSLLKKFGIWFTTQPIAETRVAKLGWFLYSHPTDGIDNFREQLCAFWQAHNLTFPDDQWQISARRFTVVSST